MPAVAVIGHGSYGTVFQLDNPRRRFQKCAVKKIKGVFRGTCSALSAYRELTVLQHLRGHSNILNLQDVYLPPEGSDENFDLFLITDLCLTDLSSHLKQEHSMTPARIQLIMYQLLRGLKYMHSAGIVHADLKTNNLLLTSNFVLKIGDFGMAKPTHNHCTGLKKLSAQWCIARHRAPEVLLGSSHCGTGVDIWAAGCIFADIVLGHNLFSGQTNEEQMELIIKMVGVPSNIADIVKRGNPKVVKEVLCKVDLSSCDKPSLEGEEISCIEGNLRKMIRYDSPYDYVDLGGMELVRFLCRMVEFDDKKRASAEALLALPYLASARMNFHASNSPELRDMYISEAREAHELAKFEPVCLQAFSDGGVSEVLQSLPDFRRYLYERMQSVNISDKPLILNCRDPVHTQLMED